MKRITFIKSIRVFSVSLIGFLFLCGTAFAVTNNLFSEFQSISTDGAHDWESFIIAGDTYLVVANHEKSGYGTANNSWIYKWNGTFFEEFQPIPTLGAMDWEAFTIAGETFIAVANTNDGPNLDVDSKIYKWNGTSFEEFQSIPTDMGWDWEVFTIAGENFLAIANYYKASTHNVDSRIYKWDETVPAFVEIQAIPTIGAHDWESFDIDGETYLAVAHFADGSNHNLNSKIFKWNGTVFEEFQSIPTSGAWDWESFSIAGDMYLAVANTNSGDGSNYNVDSRIYKWNGTSFEEFQTIPTNGALDWESFAMAGNSYLVVANYTNNSTNNVDSHIYEWNGTFFEEFQSILTNGAREWESFKIGGKTYLAVANNGNTTHYYIADSEIYQIDRTLPPPRKGKNKPKKPIGVAQTGQTIFYEVGDDGDLQMGTPLTDPRFTDNEDGTVTDNLTGLIWLRDANCFGEKNWYNALSACNLLEEGECGLTDGSMPGDWRLPNVREMLSLIDYGYYDPALTPNHPFENVPGYPGRYWVSTTMANNPAESMHVPIVNGAVNGMNKLSNLRLVWAVRGGN